MDKTKIPTTKVAIKGLDSELVLYNWLTQDESQAQLDIITEGKDLSPTNLKDGSLQLSVSSGIIGKLNRFKIESLCQNLTWDDFNVLSPDLRDKILSEIDKILNKKK